MIEAFSQKFYPDDPIEVMPPPINVGKVANRGLNQLSDFVLNSRRPERRASVGAGDVNTLGNVPNSPWFTNRHGKHRMTREELQRGPATAEPPIPPFTVIGEKTEGISAGFSMKDARGRRYFVKPDSPDHPEMTTGSDVIVSKFLYAIGYNTPANYLIYARLSDFILQDKINNNRQPELQPEQTMARRDFLQIIAPLPRSPDGSFRLMASLAVEGKPIGPFRFEGTRDDDPNDTVPHENRRDLRGLSIFAAWLNHTDSKAGNTLDTLVEVNGVRFIKHYLIDFGAALGSDSMSPKDARLGHDYMLPAPGDVWKRIVRLGLLPERWERAKFPDMPAVGNFESTLFEPEEWKSNYPNPAFLSRLTDDEFWAAKIIMSFNNDDIRAIVETARFSDPAAAAYITETLVERRNKIGRTFFSKVLPLDHFRVQGEELTFENLAVKYGFSADPAYTMQWFLFDNVSEQRSLSLSSDSVRLPTEAYQLPAGTYLSAVIQSKETPRPAVTVTIRKTSSGYDIVGIERLSRAPLPL
jgi:hypothetical protein